MHPVIITTDRDKRGVFFGFVDSLDFADVKTIKDCQMVVYWDASVKGLLSMAVHGPNSECRITAPATSATVNGVTAIITCTPKAVEEFKKEYWR